MDKLRTSSKASLKKLFCNAPLFKSEAETDSYVARIDEGIYSEHTNAEDYRDQLQAIVANAPNIVNFLHEFDPFQLGKCDPLAIATKTARVQRKREKVKRARESEIFDTTSTICTNCKLVRRDRLNLNRMGLDSEELGTQFEYNFDNFCSCETAADAKDEPDHGGDGEEHEEPVSSDLSEDD